MIKKSKIYYEKIAPLITRIKVLASSNSKMMKRAKIEINCNNFKRLNKLLLNNSLFSHFQISYKSLMKISS